MLEELGLALLEGTLHLGAVTCGGGERGEERGGVCVYVCVRERESVCVCE